MGDTARVPYGTKSGRVVKRYTLEATLFLLSKGVKCIVVACNTASSLALPVIEDLIPIPFIGVIGPGAKEALRISGKKRIGVIGTEATVGSGAYVSKIKALDPKAHVFQLACPLFVPLVEGGHICDEISRMVAEKYLSYFYDKDIDVLILGCTHYPLLISVIEDALPGVSVVDSATSVARALYEMLEGKDLLRDGGTGKTTFYVTDDPSRFSSVARIFLNGDIGGEVRFVESLEVF